MERIKALDGIRAVAIAMVVGYHADKEVVPAGLWGVVLFFVLSGYLITRLLCIERDRHGEIELKHFYLKRATRLYPALYVVCLILLGVGLIGWSNATPTLGLYGNYARIAGVDLGLLTHTWFLSVIAHFYLIWPLVIAAVRPRHRIRVIGLLAVVAIVWRVVAIGVLSPGWVYNATDTNAAALLAGCFLAVIPQREWRFAGWSIPLLLGLIFVPYFGEESPAFTWGHFIALALSVAAIQYALTRPSWLETRVMVWLGKVSYGLYLWHYVFLRSGLFSIWVALPLSVAAAAASWYLLEAPLQRWRKRFEREVLDSDTTEADAGMVSS